MHQIQHRGGLVKQRTGEISLGIRDIRLVEHVRSLGATRCYYAFPAMNSTRPVTVNLHIGATAVTIRRYRLIVDDALALAARIQCAGGKYHSQMPFPIFSGGLACSGHRWISGWLSQSPKRMLRRTVKLTAFQPGDGPN